MTMNTRAYPWRTAFLCAVFERDPTQVPSRVSKATQVIDARLARPAQPDADECRAIEDARTALATLGAEARSKEKPESPV